MPTLQANAHTFMFAMPGTQCFYSVLLASSEPHAAHQCFASHPTAATWEALVSRGAFPGTMVVYCDHSRDTCTLLPWQHRMVLPQVVQPREP